MRCTLFFVALGLLPAAARAALPAQPDAIVLRQPDLPGYSAQLTASLTRTVERAGFHVSLQDAARLARPGALSREQCALLAIPQGASLPQALIEPIERYVQGGGRLIALGAPLWRKVLVRTASGAWATEEEIEETHALEPPEHPVFDLSAGLAEWQRTTNDLAIHAQTSLVEVEAAGRRSVAIHTVMDDLTGWETFASPTVPHPFRPGDTDTVLNAKGDRKTSGLAVEWTEDDGSRWIATIPVTTRWRQYRLTPADFKLWGPSHGSPQLRPEHAVRFTIGLAFTHTGFVGGRHEYWAAGIGTAPPLSTPRTGSREIQPVDLVAPDYKYFSIRGPVALRPPRGQAIAPDGPSLETSADVRSAQPRPGGGGWNKGRDWRYQTLLEARDPRTGEWRGSPVTLLAFSPGSKMHGAAILAAGTDDTALLQSPMVQRAIEGGASALRGNALLMDGGTEFYTVFPGRSVRLGARAAAYGTARADLSARVTVRDAVGNVVKRAAWPLRMAPGKEESVSADWMPPARQAEYAVTTELLAGRAVIDRVTNAFSVWEPPAGNFITITPEGHFTQSGTLWRPFGVNYMPSSGIGLEDSEMFEFWLDRRAYDPEIIDRDLAHIHELGMNAVSVFLYARSAPAQNITDLLRRCRHYGLKVNLSLRPALISLLDSGRQAAIDKAAEADRAMIRDFRLGSDDTIFAYEIDWEPTFGHLAARQRWDADWNTWLIKRYGGLEGARRAWGEDVPVNAAGLATSPTDQEMSTGFKQAPHRVTAYRNFMDDWLTGTYGALTGALRTADPHHPVSFRMTNASHATWDGGGDPPYQFEGLARAVDFLAPESYGDIGQPKNEGGLLFRMAYARSIAPRMPILWAETGMSVWDSGAGIADPDSLAVEGRYYARMIELARQTGSDGIFWWWYPGGLRVNERSDYGLINPDGTDRPATTALRKYGPAFLRDPLPAPTDTFIRYNRDDFPDGAVGVFRSLGEKFAALQKAGRRPGLQRAGGPVRP